MASDLLSTIRAELDARMNELRSSLAEYERLLVAADALIEDAGPSAKLTVPRTPSKLRTPGTPRTTRAPDVPRGSAAGAIERAAGSAGGRVARRPSISKPQAGKPKSPRAQRGAAHEAILAALGHGSHTVGELAVVTAMSAPNINGNLRRMASDGAVVKTEREGKMAYALAKTG